MNPSTRRALVVEGVIIMALCLGAWMMWTQPATQSLRQVEAENEQMAHAAPTVGGPSVIGLADHASRLASRVEAIAARSAAARDTAGIYRRCTELARAHGVTVLSLSPGDSAPARAEMDQGPSQYRINLSVEGSYEAVARFIEAIDGVAGYSRIASLEVSVRDAEGAARVHAEFTCETLSFPLVPVLAAVRGGDHAQP
jgi:Tfp pilus assembly protein PilO